MDVFERFWICLDAFECFLMLQDHFGPFWTVLDQIDKENKIAENVFFVKFLFCWKKKVCNEKSFGPFLTHFDAFGRFWRLFIAFPKTYYT